MGFQSNKTRLKKRKVNQEPPDVKIMGKVVSRNEIKSIVQDLKKQNKIIVFTNGCFDILHTGHARYLKASKKCGDILIVGVNSDLSVKRLKGETRPINNEQDRMELLSYLYFVDYVVLFEEESPSQLIDEIKPDIYTKGADYTLETLPEAPIVLKNGGRVEFIELVEGKSTTNVIKKINS